MAIIYADTLFAVNFSMDFIALYITGKSLKTKTEPKRLALCAVGGALFATVYSIIPLKNFGGLIFFIAEFLLCPLIMCYNAYSCRILKSTALFVAVNLGLGGIISALCGLLQQNGFEAVQTLEVPTLMLFAAVAATINLAYGRFFKSKPHDVICYLKLFGKEYKLDLLCDSGDLLCEPISGKPVIFVSPKKIELTELSPYSTPPELICKIRAIPSESIGGTRLIYGFSSVIKTDKKEIEVVIAPIDSDYNGFDGIIPSSLCQV